MKTAVYFLNLDRAPDRATFMKDQFSHAGISDPVRVSALDAAATENFTSPRYAPHRWGPYWSMTPTEIAVFEGHRKTWETIVETGVPGAIFEDDTLLSSTVGGVLSDLGQAHSQFDLIKLDTLGGRFRFGASSQIAGQTLRQIVGVLPSAAAYLLSPRGAARLLDHAQSYCDHLDDFVTRPERGLRAFQLVPGVAVQGMFADLRHRPDIPQSVAGSERTNFGTAATDAGRGPFAYRLLKEVRRSGRKLSQKLGADRRLIAQGGLIGEVPLADDLPAFKR